MRVGIPTYRLLRDVLDAEIQRIVDLGVKIEHDRKVSDLEAAAGEGRFDAAFFAVGQETERSPLDRVPGTGADEGVVTVDERMIAGHPGIFAGGEVVGAERIVTVGVGHGRQAARRIDSWLRGEELVDPPRPEPVASDRLNPWYHADAPRTARPRLDMARRRSTFEELTGGLDESDALLALRRCLWCGNRVARDSRCGVSLGDAVVKLERPGRDAYEIDLDYRKGGGLCAAECPCDAIATEAETI